MSNSQVVIRDLGPAVGINDYRSVSRKPVRPIVSISSLDRATRHPPAWGCRKGFWTVALNLPGYRGSSRWGASSAPFIPNLAFDWFGSTRTSGYTGRDGDQGPRSILLPDRTTDVIRVTVDDPNHLVRYVWHAVVGHSAEKADFTSWLRGENCQPLQHTLHLQADHHD